MNDTITDRQLNKLFELSTSPILNEIAQKKINDLRKTYNDQFHTHLFIASKGVPSFFNLDLDSEQEKQRLQELKKQNQSLLSNVSTTKTQMKDLLKPRKEVIDIIEWLDSQLNKLEFEESKISELFQQKQRLFQACIAEISRQISADCKERGLLIKLLWNNNQDLANEMISYLLKAKDDHEKNYLKQSSKMHLTYQQELKRVNDLNTQLNKQLKDKDYEIKSMQYENAYQLKKILKLEKQIKVNNKQYHLMQRDYQEALSENIKLSMINQNIDWELASQIKQNMLNQKNDNVFTTLKKIESQTQNQDDQQQQDVNEMVEKYLTEVNQEVQDIVEIEDKKITQFTEENGSKLYNKQTDTEGLQVNQNKETETIDLLKVKDFCIQFLYEQHTQICQTDVQFQKTAICQTELETYEEYCQTDFKNEISQVHNETQPKQDNFNKEEELQQDTDQEDQKGDLAQSQLKTTQLEVVEQVEEEDLEDDERISINVKKGKQILKINDEIKQLLKDKKINEVRKLIKQNSQLIKEFVASVQNDMQSLSQEKKDLKSNILTQVIELDQNEEVMNQQQKFLSMLQKDLIDLEEMAAIEGDNQMTQNESKISNVTISSPLNFQDVIQQYHQKRKESFTQTKVQKAQKQPQTERKSLTKKDLTSSNQNKKQFSRQVSIKQIYEEKKSQILKQKGLSSRQPYTHKSQHLEIASILLINSYQQALKDPVNQVKALTQQNVLKTLQMIFLELLKLNRKNEKIQNPLHVYIYEHCLQKFGLKNVAERNYQYTILNLYHLRKENDYFKLFSKLIFTDELQHSSASEVSINELMKTLHQDGTQLGFVLNLIAYLDEYNQRNTCAFEKMYTTLFKIKDSYTKWLNDMMPQEQLFKQLDKLESEGLQPMSQINLFRFIQQLLDLSVNMLEKIENSIGLILNNSSEIFLSSFLLYFRVLEKSELSQLDLLQKFEDEADKYDEILGEQAMSKREFILFCTRHSLFQQKSIQRILNSIFSKQNQFQEDYSYLNKCLQLKKKWAKRAKKLKWRFFQKKRYTNAHKKIIDSIDNDLQCFEQNSGQELENMTQRICFQYALLKKDLKLLQEDIQIFDLIPSELLVTQYILARKMVPKCYALIQK